MCIEARARERERLKTFIYAREARARSPSFARKSSIGCCSRGGSCHRRSIVSSARLRARARVSRPSSRHHRRGRMRVYTHARVYTDRERAVCYNASCMDVYRLRRPEPRCELSLINLCLCQRKSLISDRAVFFLFHFSNVIFLET